MARPSKLTPDVTERVVQAMRAGNRLVGRRLWRLLAEAGFEELALEVIAFHSDELGIEAFLPQFDPQRYRPFVVPGGLTQEEWDSYRAAYEEWRNAPDAYVLQLILLVSGRRPEGSSTLGGS